MPIAIFSGAHDGLSDPVDVKLLLPKLQKLVFFDVLQEFNHVDFVVGLNSPTVLFPNIIELLIQYTQE